MMCDHCGEKEAVIHLTQIVNNELSTFHLCEPCAAAKGLEPGAGAEANVPLTDFIAQMGQTLPSGGGNAPDECDYCGLTPEDFKRTGRLGCPHCYIAFEDQLRALMRRLHGGTQHVGKVYLPPDPTQADRQGRLRGLRRKLDRAVEFEDFERAAQIRDQIRALETAT